MLDEYDSFDERHEIIDSSPPINAQLCAIYKRSFAYETFRVRIFRIVSEIIDDLRISADELICKYGPDAKWDSKRVVESLERLLDAVNKNKQFEIFYGNEKDFERWNKFMNDLPEEKNSWYTAVWLYAENYFYRRIAYFFQRTKTLRTHDFYERSKKSSLFRNLRLMEAVTKATRKLPLCEKSFTKLLKLQLWANRCDLSITKQQYRPDFYEQISSLDINVLANESHEVWECLSHADNSRSAIIVDIVCDNAGFEFFADLMMAEYIIDKQLAAQVRFHVKAMPWYISDLTHNDYHYTLRFLRQAKVPCLSRLGRKLTKYTEEEKFLLEPVNYFWTCPYEHFRMRVYSPCLYVHLADAALVILKGDLNYRKLVGDYSFNTKEAFADCLKGFHPTNVCALRTLKADVACGLPVNCAAELTVQYLGSEWMLTGEYGVIQFAKKPF